MSSKPDPKAPASSVAAPVDRLGPGTSHAAGWLLGAVVNAVFIVFTTPTSTKFSVRLLHHAFDLGHFAALGLLSGVVVWAWKRNGPQQARWGLLALTVVASLVGAVLLPENLDNFASRMGGPTALIKAAAIVAVAAVVPCAAIAGQRLGRLRSPFFGVGFAALMFAANNLVLTGDYEGGHFFLAWAAAVLAGATLTDLEIPAPWAKRVQQPPLVAAIGVAALLSIVIRPSERVWTLQTSLDGSVLAQQLGAAFRTQDEPKPADLDALPPELVQWFKDRSKTPDIAPSTPALVPSDAIVLLITMDAVRAEILNDEKYREIAPRLFEIAAQSVRFTEARSPGSSTLTTMASVFSGKHRPQLDWRKNKKLNWNLASDPTTRFTEKLQKAKVPTFQAVAWTFLRQRHAIVKGFDTELFVEPPEGQRFALAEAMLAPLRERLQTHQDGPLFMFAHLMDPHEPYDSVTTEGSDFDRHLAEIATCDREIGRLWDLVEERGLLDRLVLIVAADHGEGFGLHSTPFHTYTTYEELVRVPLIIRVPGVTPRTVNDPVSLLDVGPTVLDLLGIKTPGTFMGQTLTGYLRGQDPKLTRPIVGTARVAGSAPIFYWYANSGYKAIWNQKRGTREIYDLNTDPGELENIFDDLGEAEREPMRLLQSFVAGQPFYSDVASGTTNTTPPAKKKRAKPRKGRKKARATKKPATEKPVTKKPAPATSTQGE